MLNRKMSPEEAIERIEIILKNSKFTQADKLALKSAISAFAYINQLESDLTAMRMSANSYKIHYEKLEAEVQRLKGIINKDVLLVRPRSGKTEIVRQMILLRVKEIKSEAVKEFAQFLVDKSENGVISVADLPEYVIEMVGDDGMTLNDMSKTLSDKVAVHLNLPYPDELEELRDFNSITAQMMVQIVDMTDNAILQEIINYAKKNKICDVYLLDKSFVKNALEKQTPKKATAKITQRGYDIDFDLRCPICGAVIGTFEEGVNEYFSKYCGNCGQALDWSDI